MDSDKNKSPAPPVLIDIEDLSEDALSGIIGSFIQRDGTDYGFHEVQFSTKFEQVLKKIKSKEFLITFDHDSESVTILTKNQWKDLMKGQNYEL